MIDNLEQRVSNKLYNKWPITKIAEAANLIVMGHMFSHMQPVLAKSRPNFRTAHDGPSAKHIGRATILPISLKPMCDIFFWKSGGTMSCHF